MNFISGRQCFNLGQLDDAQTALRKLLVYESQQQPFQQASHLREFLAVFKVGIIKHYYRMVRAALLLCNLIGLNCKNVRCNAWALLPGCSVADESKQRL